MPRSLSLNVTPCFFVEEKRVFPLSALTSSYATASPAASVLRRAVIVPPATNLPLCPVRARRRLHHLHEIIIIFPPVNVKGRFAQTHLVRGLKVLVEVCIHPPPLLLASLAFPNLPMVPLLGAGGPTTSRWS